MESFQQVLDEEIRMKEAELPSTLRLRDPEETERLKDIRQKHVFLHHLAAALHEANCDIQDIGHDSNINFVDVIYTDGSVLKINVSGDSCKAMLQDIAFRL